MDWLLLLKFVHVLAAMTAVGANVTYAVWLRAAGRDRERLVYTIETVHRLDMRLANPAYGVVLVTGVLIVLGGLYSFETGWIVAAIVLYAAIAVLGITVFGPAVRRQLAEAQADPGSAAYATAARTTTRLGLLTTAIVIVIVTLREWQPVGVVPRGRSG